jgi:patatin-like phospholipase/acyl hydrolase
MKKVLSLDGGGVRGLVPAVLLSNLEQETGTPVAEMFDMVVGTSTGGVLAAAAAVGVPMTVVVEMYRSKIPEIFNQGRLSRLRSVWGARTSRYQSEALQQALSGVLGDSMLSDALCSCMVTSYELNTMSSKFFKSHKALEHPGEDILMWQSCMATTAAPTFFKAFDLNGIKYIDGGVHSNNPAMCALAEAIKLWPGEQVKLLSIGTGSAMRHSDLSFTGKFGVVRWLRPLLDVFMSSSDSTVDYQCNAIMGGDYLRIDPSYYSKMDDASKSNIAAMEQYSNHAWKSHREEVISFIGR